MPVHDPLFDFSDTVVAITGGGRGLGRVMAEAFAARGARVAIASRKREACEAAAADIAASTGADVVGLGLHVGRWDECEPFIAEVAQRLGPIDVLVNNAGSSPLYPALHEVSEGLFDAVVGVNMKGPFRLSAVLLRDLAERGAQGSIINVSSIASIQPSAHDLSLIHI